VKVESRRQEEMEEEEEFVESDDQVVVPWGQAVVEMRSGTMKEEEEGVYSEDEAPTGTPELLFCLTDSWPRLSSPSSRKQQHIPRQYPPPPARAHTSRFCDHTGARRSRRLSFRRCHLGPCVNQSLPQTIPAGRRQVPLRKVQSPHGRSSGR
jgi:hypothetical protein